MLSALSSCSFDFDVRNDTKPGLYIQFVSSEEGGALRFKTVSRLGVNAQDIPEAKLQELTVTVAGREAAVTAAENGVLYLDYPQALKAGDKLEISAKSAELGQVRAQGTIPAALVPKKVELTKDKMAEVDMLIFDTELESDVPAGTYVGIYIAYETLITAYNPLTRKDTVIVNCGMLSPNLSVNTDPSIELAQINYNAHTHEILSDNPASMLDEKGEPVRNMELMTLVPAKAFRDRHYSLLVMDFSNLRQDRDDKDQGNGPGIIPGSGSGGNAGDIDWSKFVKEKSTSYSVACMGVSEDFYRYSLARYKSTHDFMAMMGLAPAQFAWSNIQGGYGVCAGVSTLSSFIDVEVK